MSVLMGISKFERFFREAAGVDVDKDDLRRYSDFVSQKVYDLLIAAQATASANGRDVIEPRDLPITKGLQERIQEYKRLTQQIELQPILDYITPLPALNLGYSDETESTLPVVAGGLSVALARSFKVVDPEVKNPQTKHWEQAFGVANLVI